MAMNKTIDKKAIKAVLDADKRDITSLWNEAVEAWNLTTGIPLAGSQFKSTNEMIQFGHAGAEAFQSWRHGDKRVDKLRTLFMQNIGFIETGANQLIAAASGAFPPAAAIGTALTLVLGGCKNQKADYDAVVNFFEDMNNFLQRVTIIEKRVPRKPAYQNALMDVFSSLLHMCAVARKFVDIGRFKKWAINTILGGDAELAGGRAAMDTNLKRLQSATEFAILDNSENMLEKQDVLGSSLASFQQELRRNQTIQERLAQTQALALENISTGIEDLSGDLQDIKRLLMARNEDGNSQSHASEAPSKAMAKNPIKALLDPYVSEPDPMDVLASLKSTRVPGTGSWIFQDATWLEWKGSTSAQLAIQGERGIGKTHLSVAVYDHINQMAQDDPGRHTCVAYFQCRKSDDSSNYTMALLAACAVQIVDQHAVLRQQLFDHVQRDEVLLEFYEYRYTTEDEFKNWDLFLLNLFPATSQYQLFIVIDSIDELLDQDQRDRFHQLIRSIEERRLRIKIVVTRTSSESFLDAPVIIVDRNRLRTDLRDVVRDRLHNSDSMYGGITRLTKRTKQKLARKLEHHADGLLYAEQMLRFLGSFQRETAVDKVIDGTMPKDVAQIYGMMLDRAQSRINPGYLPGMKLVVTWAVFAFRPLSLSEIGQVAAMIPFNEGVAEDIMSERLKTFFETSYIDSPDLQTIIDSNALFEETLTSANVGDDKLQLALRDDSMKAFFGSDPMDGVLRTTFTLAHYRIFLTSLDTMRQCKTTQSSTLDKYSAEFCLRHWSQIPPLELPEAKQMTACRYFANLVEDGCWSNSLRNLPSDVSMSDVLGDVDEFKKTWNLWSQLSQKLELDANILAYWRAGSDNALWPLAKSLLCNWLRASDAPAAIKAYNVARAVVKYTGGRRHLNQTFEYDKDVFGTTGEDLNEVKTTYQELKSLAAASDMPSDANTSFAIGAILSARNAHRNALQEHQNSLNLCTSQTERIRSQINIAFAYRKMEDWDQTIVNCDTVLNQSTTTPHYVDDWYARDTIKSTQAGIEPTKPSTSSDPVMPGYRRWALLMKAKALESRGRFSEAAFCYRNARVISSNIVSPRDLLNELTCLWKNDDDFHAVMDTLMNSFKPIERLNLITNPYLWENSEIEPWHLVLLATAKTGRQDDMVKLYREVIKTLDAEEAGAPVRLELAEAQWSLQHDVAGAKVLLDQIFDSVHDTLEYKLTEKAVMDVIMDGADLMASILLRQFRNSSSAEDKVQIMLELKDLPNRSLPSCTVVTASAWHGCRLALARMLQKVGPASEYQAIMNQVFEECLENLRDSTEANDGENIFMLAKLLGTMPGLERYGSLVMSATNQELGPQEKERSQFETNAKEGWSDVPCDGMCLPRVSFNPWDQDAYMCLVCGSVGLCEDCHRTRLEWNRTSRPADEPEFCCDNGMYLKAPIDGWLGMKDGVMSIAKTLNQSSGGANANQAVDEVEKIEFSKLLEDVEVAWKKAWQDHWAGY